MVRKVKKNKDKSLVLIKNYGLFWEHDKVNWCKKPSLKGYAPKHRECCFDDQIGIYVLYDENKEVLYAGQAGRGDSTTLLTRLKNHNSDGTEGWWKYFSWFGLKGLNRDGTLSKWSTRKFHSSKDKTLDSLEGILIAAINPKMNKQGEKLGIRFKQCEFQGENQTNLKKMLEEIKSVKIELKNLKKRLDKCWCDS